MFAVIVHLQSSWLYWLLLCFMRLKSSTFFTGTCCWRSVWLERCVSGGSRESPWNQKVTVYRFKICFELIRIMVPRSGWALIFWKFQLWSSFSTSLGFDQFWICLSVPPFAVLGERRGTRTLSPSPRGLCLHGASHIFGRVPVEASNCFTM